MCGEIKFQPGAPVLGPDQRSGEIVSSDLKVVVVEWAGGAREIMDLGRALLELKLTEPERALTEDRRRVFDVWVLAFGTERARELMFPFP